MNSKLVSKLANKISGTNTLDYKFVSIRFLETNLEFKILVIKTLLVNG